MTKVSGRWLPSLLRQQDKLVRDQMSKHFLERYEREGEQSCRASLSVMNHGSISMIWRQKLSQWCGNIHHHLHQRRLSMWIAILLHYCLLLSGIALKGIGVEIESFPIIVKGSFFCMLRYTFLYLFKLSRTTRSDICIIWVVLSIPWGSYI